jgi:hypothetical protein
MPVHDWTKVDAWAFHDLHIAWVAALMEVLNEGLLPPGYHVLAEQAAGSTECDLLPVARPQARFTATLDVDPYAQRRRTLVIRHTSGDRVVALIEIISPGNKAAQYPFRSLLEKAIAALEQGIHLLLIDLFPPTPRDPRGLHSALWEELGGEPFQAPEGEPLIVASYFASRPPVAYLWPGAVGRPLPDAGLFLAPDALVNVPLEATYARAWRGVPFPVRRALDA